MGAPRVHVVDLDGAASGKLENVAIITEIASALLIPTQIGGGIRDLPTIESLLRAGIDRVVLGTAAVEDPKLVTEACRNYCESIIVGIDIWKGQVAIRGWQEHTGLRAIEFAHTMAQAGVRRFLYTDISRDGTLTEPNLAAVAEFVAAVKLPTLAAGGITSITHLSLLASVGVEGAIVGKALYTGNINLKQALATIS
jgi:phosphoribosylformimino-5-aminoimidazole carboxamide ribotide isomerase